MGNLFARSVVFCLLAGLAGCRSNGVQASSLNGAAQERIGSAGELSGPPTFNTAYQARNPRACARLTTPPSAAQAAVLVQCSTESDSSGSATPLLTLTTEVNVEMGAPREYIPGINTPSSIDPSARVYPIRGKGILWQCMPIAESTAGQNCMNYPPVAPASGECFKTTFGDWECQMGTGGPRQVTKLKGPTTY